MFDRMPEADLKEYSMANVSTTPNRRTAFGDSGMDAEALKKRFDRLPRYIANKLNELLDGIPNGDLAKAIAVKHGDELYGIEDFVKMLLSGKLDIDVNAKGKTVSLNQLGDDVFKNASNIEVLATNAKELKDSITSGKLAEDIIVIDGVSLQNFYNKFVNLEKVDESITNYLVKEIMSLNSYAELSSIYLGEDGIYYNCHSTISVNQDDEAANFNTNTNVPIVPGENVSFEIDEETRAVKINSQGGGGGGANCLSRYLVYARGPEMTMEELLDAITLAGGSISNTNIVQLYGYMSDLIAIRFQSYGGVYGQVHCVILDSLTKVYSPNGGGPIDITETRIGEFFSDKFGVARPADINTDAADAEIVEYLPDRGVVWANRFAISYDNGFETEGDFAICAPFVAGDNVTFDIDQDAQVVKIHAKGGSGHEIVEALSNDGITYYAQVPSITELKPGVSFTMIPNGTNLSAKVQLKVNALGVKTLIRPLWGSATSGAAIPAGELKANVPYRVVYTGDFWALADYPKIKSSDLNGRVSVGNGGVPTSTASNVGQVLTVSDTGVAEWDDIYTVDKITTLTENSVYGSLYLHDWGITWRSDFEIELDDGAEYIYPASYRHIPIVAGEGILFEVDEESQTVKIKIDPTYLNK